MRIRTAKPGDEAALARVIVDSGRAAHRGQMPDDLLERIPLAEAYAESERNWARALREIAAEAVPEAQIFVAEGEAGAVVGLGMGGPPKQELLDNAGEVYALYVLQSHHGRGLGRRLVHAIARHLAGTGATALLIGCLAANQPARRFYEALGGRVVAERTFDQDGTPLPEVVYGWEDMRPLLGMQA